MNLDIISSNKSFGGWHKRYSHASEVLGCEMRFAIYLPPQALTGQKVPVLYWLSGLTCTDETSCRRRAPSASPPSSASPWWRRTPARAAKTSRTTPVTISAWAPASTSTPPSIPGAITTRCTTMSPASCPSSSRPTSQSRPNAPSAVTPWVATGAHRRSARTRSLPLGVGLQPHQPPEPLSLGPEGTRRLPRQQPLAVAGGTPASCCATIR